VADVIGTDHGRAARHQGLSHVLVAADVLAEAGA
jgi:hypothetical protein